MTYETVRQWCQKFCPAYARTFRKQQGRMGDAWHIDAAFVTIQGERHYLWRGVEQGGDVIDILVQRCGNQPQLNAYSGVYLKDKAVKITGSLPIN